MSTDFLCRKGFAPGLLKAGLPMILLALWPVFLCQDSHGAVLKRSDVVFMYQADRSVYEAYGATVLAWGGRPTPRSLEQAKGVKFFGSVGMVTEFSRYYERFPDEYEKGLCRDVNGQPVKVPWLTDHQHKGIPYWWCCTQQPVFRQYLKERVIDTVKAGADGLHIDDHLGSAGGLWLGLCFCDRCVEGFRTHLASLPAAETKRLGIDDPETHNYREVVRTWIAAEPAKRKSAQHPLWNEWTVYQCRASAAFMEELHSLANQTAGRPVPMGANAGLLWPRHLADYRTLDLFSAETDHHASERRFSDLPLFAYRMADAVGRPYAATASGGDWAFVAEHKTPGLVRGWIALSYAAGHCLMAPHRQWCYTPEKGTHWYQGPAEKFVPLYQFVRRNATLFDDYETHADVSLVLPHRAFIRNPNPWFDIGREFAAKNISYRLLLGGDAIVDHPLPRRELAASPVLLAPQPGDLLPEDRRALAEAAEKQPIYERLADALKAVKPAVQVENDQPVRVLARVASGSAVIHVLNDAYRAEQDDVRSLEGVRLRVNLGALGLKEDARCWFYEPDAAPVQLEAADGVMALPRLGLWSIVRLGEEAPAQR
ncbi:MAG: hypothetical protein AB9869_28290 [Verrucomicrobiia bacterium]